MCVTEPQGLLCGLWCRLTGWHYNRVYTTGEQNVQRRRRGRTCFIRQQLLFKTLCALVVGASPHVGCHNRGGAWHLCGGWRKPPGQEFLLHSRLLALLRGRLIPVRLFIVDGHGRLSEEIDQHILLRRLTGQARELAQRLPCKFINKWWPT